MSDNADPNTATEEPLMVARSILFPGGGVSLQETTELAARFDAQGFHGLYCVEAYRSGFVPLTVLAAATSTCRVGTYILNAHARPPIAAAMAARDLDDLTDGRVVIGVGSGNPHINEHHLGASNAKPLRFMRDYVTGLRRALAANVGETVQFLQGDKEISWSPAIPLVRERVPVLMAAMYPGMRRLAGSVADGVALGSLHSAEYVRDVVRPDVLRALAEGGREATGFKFVASALTAVGDDADAARTMARRGLCRLFTPLPHPYYEYVLREQGWSSMVDQISRAMAAEDLDAAIKAVPDAAVDSLLIAGGREDCDAGIDRYAGVLDEVILTDATSVGASIKPGTPGAREGLEALLALSPFERSVRA
jgi:alkanesulfonate monooxygenase SsuD/methylene tetrahydromethanopterin reductase-like flavin-dependent oxidoreductase (luciferase family)